MIAPAAPPPARIKTVQDRINELQQTVSASRLNMWQGCRLKFYFGYVQQIKRSSSTAQYVGTMVHWVLQAWSMARWKNKPALTADLRQEFDKSWATKQEKSPILWQEGEEQESKSEAWALIETYLSNTPIKPDEKPEAVEVSVEADLGHHGLPRLIGIIDLVRQGRRIVDFKTAGQTPNPRTAGHLNETQLSCYSVLYRDCTGSHETGLELHHLVKLKTPKLVISELPPMTPGQEIRLFKIMESYQRGLDQRDWIPSPSPMACACCEFFSNCRKWS